MLTFATLASIGEAPKRRQGVNPYALAALTAVAGVGVGAWLVLAAPDTPAPAPAIETASVSDFQGDGTGTDGFSVSRPKPQIVPAAPDTSEAKRLQAEVDALTAQIADLKANPVTDEAALAALKAQVEALDAEAKTRAAALSDLERENIRLQTELETNALIAGDGEAEAAGWRDRGAWCRARGAVRLGWCRLRGWSGPGPLACGEGRRACLPQGRQSVRRRCAARPPVARCPPRGQTGQRLP